MEVSGARQCEVCQRATANHPLARLCVRCRKIVDRIEPRHVKHDVNARIRALSKAWDGEGFRCYYTGVRLVEDNQYDPRYLTLDHRVPGREDDIVVAALLINQMKSKLTEDEFKLIIAQLKNRFNGGTFDESVFKLSRWKER